jgi:hypothetical protein
MPGGGVTIIVELPSNDAVLVHTGVSGLQALPGGTAPA